MGVIQAYSDYCDKNELPGLVLDLGIAGKFDLIVDAASVAFILEDRADNFHKSYIDKASMGTFLIQSFCAMLVMCDAFSRPL